MGFATEFLRVMGQVTSPLWVSVFSSTTAGGLIGSGCLAYGTLGSPQMEFKRPKNPPEFICRRFCAYGLRGP